MCDTELLMASLEYIEKHLREEAGDEDVVFRIGGDEFCVLTDSRSVDCAAELAERIRRRNGESFSFEGREIPLALHAAVFRPGQGTGPVGCDELFLGLHRAVREGKR